MTKTNPPDNAAKKYSTDNQRVASLYQKVSGHIDHARSAVRKTVNIEMVKAYWLMGQDIVEEEQYGKARAGYGQSVLQSLSDQLSKKYGRGFSVDTLERVRKFYLSYKDYQGIQKISATPLRKLEPPHFSENLSWAHYLLLLKVRRIEARCFYEIEAERNNWTHTELQRQIASLLFDRLAKNKDKYAQLKLAQQGHEIIKPSDSIKDPMVFDFLGTPFPSKLQETQLETALINHLQDFLLELGRGFAFLARQKRLTLDGKHFYADLVMYHVVLKCYVIIDLKTNELSHADLGQIQLYVNYFDQLKLHHLISMIASTSW